MARENIAALNRRRIMLAAGGAPMRRGRVALAAVEMSAVREQRGRMVLAVFGLSELAEIKDKPVYLAIKRGFDVIVGILGMLLTLPVIFGAKIAYMVNGDFGSVIFKQKRIGKDGKEFDILKIRSMVMDADRKLEEYLAKNEVAREEYRVYKKLQNDPRITGVGKIIRKFSLDETPQFLNILMGQMSLIGNRPYLPREKEDMGLGYGLIVKVKPGLTGLWQVLGRSGVTFDDRVEIEMEYARKCGILMDLKIFLKTFMIFVGKGV